MTKGVVLFAFNNSDIDYIKQAIYCAKRVKKYLGLPVQLITDSAGYMEDTYPFYNKYIDQVTFSPSPKSTTKKFYDGIHTNYKLEWKNGARDSAFDLSIFDKTLVIDTDLLISNDKLLKCFDFPDDFMIAKDYNLVNQNKLHPDLDRISDTTIPMYWATILYFTKSKTSETIFNFVQHIKENYNYYRLIYRITQRQFRNDYAFSIAIHTMRGFVEDCSWPSAIPSDMWVSSDRDILLDVNDNTIKLLTHKDNDYTAVKIKDATTHVMNKFSLNSFIDKEFTNE
tara:strand:- start:742 stop:1590 length:849 start_codon:yes stop_codon:yes gene_type:complete